MPRTQAPQVIDRSAARSFETTLSYGTGLEAILCMLLFNGEPPFSSFEKGSEFARVARRGLPQAVSRASAKLRTPHGDAWSGLFAGMATEDGRAGDFAAVLEGIEQMPPSDVKLTMLGFARAANPRDASV